MAICRLAVAAAVAASVLISGTAVIPAAVAQSEGVELASFRILDAAGTVAEAPLLTGRTYSVEAEYRFTSSVNDRVVLATGCARDGNVYWTVRGTFPGHDPGSFAAGSPRFSVKWTEGTLSLALRCSLPASLTERVVEGGSVHLPVEDFRLIVAAVESNPSGKPLVVSRFVDLTDEAIVAADRAIVEADERRESLPASADGLRARADALLALARSLREKGQVQAASSAASGVPSGGELPDPGRATLYLVFAVALLGVGGLLAFLLKGARSTSGDLRHAVDVLSQRFEALIVHVNRVDPARAKLEREELESILKVIS